MKRHTVFIDWNIVEISILPKLIYRVNAIPITVPARPFIDAANLILKFMWKATGPRITKTILKNSERITLTQY